MKYVIIGLLAMGVGLYLSKPEPVEAQGSNYQQSREMLRFQESQARSLERIAKSLENIERGLK